MSSSGASSFSRVYCCIASTTCRRYTWVNSPASTPGSRNATSTLMTSSSRGGCVVSGGRRSHVSNSARPVSVIRYVVWVPASAPSDSTKPSRSRRCSVVYTCPVFSGHISPVPAANSCASWNPCFGPSLSSANNA